MKVARLVQEVEDLRRIMETMKMMVTVLGLEEKGGQTGIEWHDGKRRRAREC